MVPPSYSVERAGLSTSTVAFGRARSFTGSRQRSGKSPDPVSPCTPYVRPLHSIACNLTIQSSRPRFAAAAYFSSSRAGRLISSVRCRVDLLPERPRRIHPAGRRIPTDAYRRVPGFAQDSLVELIAHFAPAVRCAAPPNQSVNPTFTSLRFVHAGYLQR